MIEQCPVIPNIEPFAGHAKPLSVCMFAYTNYESDNRVRRYAETLARHGHHVHVIALGVEDHAPRPRKVINNVIVHGVHSRPDTRNSKWSYLWGTLRFLWSSSALMAELHRKSPFDIVHVHNMPDFLVFAAWYPKFHGARLILDIHDLVPELYVSKYASRMARFYSIPLLLIEKLAARFVDHVIIANHLWYDRITRRSVPPAHCSVVMNYVDGEIFYRRMRTRADGKFIMLFPGSLQWHQGVDLAITAFAEVLRNVPNAEFHIYGGAGGDQRLSLQSLVKELALEDAVKFFGGVSLDQVPEIIANADLGIVPKRADGFGNEAYSTKIMEFMSQGVPVVVSQTKIDNFYFTGGEVRFFTPGDSHAMAAAILDIVNDRELRASLVERGLAYSEENGWARKQNEYVDLVYSLAQRHRGAGVRRTRH